MGFLKIPFNRQHASSKCCDEIEVLETFIAMSFYKEELN